jgi:sterol desaturase/sphingolipid hydroxylase (fatty acid hydroxylase superfamily)
LVTYFTPTIVNAFIRNIALMFFIWYGTRNKENIHTEPKKEIGSADYLYFISSTLLQSGTEQIVQRFTVASGKSFFLLNLFLFEILFDLLHYTAHYLQHRWCYRFHKVHHTHTHPQLINTYYHHPVDLILLDCIPTVISFWVTKGMFTPFGMNLVFIYKGFIEISGHLGKHVSASCFPLCIWLPRALGIELYTSDHDLHHCRGTINFSKRFKLWDLLFGTYKIK